jgi:hypothetical protein
VSHRRRRSAALALNEHYHGCGHAHQRGNAEHRDTVGAGDTVKAAGRIRSEPAARCSRYIGPRSLLRLVRVNRQTVFCQASHAACGMTKEFDYRVKLH